MCLLLELLEADPFLPGPTCTTLQVCHRYVNAWFSYPLDPGPDPDLLIWLPDLPGDHWSVPDPELCLWTSFSPEFADLPSWLLISEAVALLISFHLQLPAHLSSWSSLPLLLPHSTRLFSLCSTHNKGHRFPSLFGGREQVFFFHYSRDSFVLSSFLS